MFYQRFKAAEGGKGPELLEDAGQFSLPQLRGEPGTPRKWRYVWYSKDGGPTATSEFTMSKTHKLYRNGRLYNLATDPFEEMPIADADRTPEDVAAAKMLQEAMAKYGDARPEDLKKPIVPREKPVRRKATR